jgi:hypothetical protein
VFSLKTERPLFKNADATTLTSGAETFATPQSVTQRVTTAVCVLDQTPVIVPEQEAITAVGVTSGAVMVYTREIEACVILKAIVWAQTSASV